MNHLKTGEILSLADGSEAIVESLEIEEAREGEEFTTYNFEVEDFHTYFVLPKGSEEDESDRAVWVHNMGCKGKGKPKPKTMWQHIKGLFSNSSKSKTVEIQSVASKPKGYQFKLQGKDVFPESIKGRPLLHGTSRYTREQVEEIVKRGYFEIDPITKAPMVELRHHIMPDGIHPNEQRVLRSLTKDEGVAARFAGEDGFVFLVEGDKGFDLEKLQYGLNDELGNPLIHPPEFEVAVEFGTVRVIEAYPVRYFGNNLIVDRANAITK